MSFVMDILRAFLVGGILCVVAQILIDRTAMTPARILVLYVCMACNMSGTKKLALYLVKCFVVSFIPAIFICLGLTSLITALAEFKAIFIIVYILANTIPGAVVIIWVRVK